MATKKRSLTYVVTYWIHEPGREKTDISHVTIEEGQEPFLSDSGALIFSDTEGRFRMAFASGQWLGVVSQG